jgi:UDP-2,3-diacylglucosamine pyrophosphatase LpxH
VNFTVTKLAHDVTRIDVHGFKMGATFNSMLLSDPHTDNQHCDRKLQTEHLNEAKAKGAAIVMPGDIFCAMQGKWDKRASKDALDPAFHDGGKYQGPYLDKLVEFVGDYYEPFAENIAVVAPGNHETSIQKHHETNLTERLVERLRARTKTQAVTSSYKGWVLYRFYFSGPRNYVTVKLFYHHGWGGGGPVTRGTIDTARMLYVPDARVVAMGHVHHAYEMPIVHDRINDAGRTYQQEQIHVRMPGYKDETSCANGFQVERGMAPRPKGAVMLTFRAVSDSAGQRTVKVSSERMH